MRKLVIAAAALAFTGSAHAADMPLLKAAPIMAAPSWTGLYIGINGGGAWGRTDTGLSVNNVPPPGFFTFFNGANIPGVQAAGSNAINNSGGLVGGQIGYLLQSGSIVGGFEAAFDWMNAKGSANVSQPYFANPQTFTINESVSSNWLFTFLGRVGFDMGSWYPYVTGGLAVADLKHTFNYTDTVFAPNCACSGSFSQVRPGVAGGAGLEWRWDNHWSLRGEYLYVVFNGVDGTSTVGNPATPTLATFMHKASFTENIARAALSYKF